MDEASLDDGVLGWHSEGISPDGAEQAVSKAEYSGVAREVSKKAAYWMRVAVNSAEELGKHGPDYDGVMHPAVALGLARDVYAEAHLFELMESVPRYLPVTYSQQTI